VAVTVYPTPRKGVPGPGGERFIDDKVLEGPVPTLLDDAFAVLLARMSRQGMVSGLGRQDRWEYPLEALREILVNAVAHRDYSPMARGTRVQVEMYPDRLEVLSPGGLFGPVSIDRFGDDGVASTRNRVLVDILENVGFPRDGRALCEGRATGIPTVIASLREAGLVPAEFADRIKDFRVVLPNRTLLDAETRDWLDGLGQQGLSSTQRMALALLRTGRALTSDHYRVEFAVDGKVARVELTDLIGRGLVRMVNQRRWARYVLDEHATPEPQAAVSTKTPPAAPSHADVRASAGGRTGANLPTEPGWVPSAPAESAAKATRAGPGTGTGTGTRTSLRAETAEIAAGAGEGVGVSGAGREPQPGVADTQELVLAALAIGPLSRREISKQVGLPDRRILYALRKLVEAGSVAPTGPARSPHVTYRLASTASPPGSGESAVPGSWSGS
jgi:predicted HTH transcriptional regulator